MAGDEVIEPLRRLGDAGFDACNIGYQRRGLLDLKTHLASYKLYE